MKWPVSVGFFVVSLSAVLATPRSANVDLAMNGTFDDNVNVRKDSDRKLQHAPTKNTERRYGLKVMIRRDLARMSRKMHRRYKRQNESDVDGGGVRRRRHDTSSQLGGHHLCQLYDLHVDVERLGWADTVVYPRRFNIRYCAGRCPLATHAHHLDASNHAVLRAIARGRRRRQLAPPSPCCVATSLRPLNLLYRDKLLGHFDIWQLNDVVADTCGCR